MSRSELLAAFRRVRIRCTPQRYAVLAYLARHPSHPTAEEVFRGVNRHIPQMSRATVYNTLRTFSNANLVREVHGLGEPARFETHIERHHHFVCEKCGRIEDVDWFGLPETAMPPGAGKWILRTYEVTLRGLCAKCSGPHKQ